MLSSLWEGRWTWRSCRHVVESTGGFLGARRKGRIILHKCFKREQKADLELFALSLSFLVSGSEESYQDQPLAFQ